jgi:hypothetical protein
MAHNGTSWKRKEVIEAALKEAEGSHGETEPGLSVK